MCKVCFIDYINQLINSLSLIPDFSLALPHTLDVFKRLAPISIVYKLKSSMCFSQFIFRFGVERTVTMKIVLALLFAVACLQLCSSAKILGLFTSPNKSHLIIHMGVAKALADAGHNVTVVSTMPYKSQGKQNYRLIQLKTAKALDPEFMKGLINEPRPFHKIYSGLVDQTTKGTNATFYTPEMQQLMAEETFDLVIMGYFYNDFQIGVAAHFKCPIILSFMFQLISPLDNMIGNPLEMSYVPAVYTGLKQPMGFLNRMKTFFYMNFVELPMFRKTEALHEKYYNSLFPSEKYPTYEQMKKNISMIFVNHHFSQGPIRPNVPGIVEIGGIMIKDKPDPLPTQFQEFLDSAKDTGAIYFSLGTNVFGAALKKDKLEIMFKVMSGLKQKVLWKWDDTASQPGKSDNIMFANWVPQDDILAHPNVKLFVTHGGRGGVVESQYHGVPMVGIPFFGDQHSNLVELERDGHGIKVDYTTMTEENFRKAVKTVLNQKSYSENVKRYSMLYKDRPLTSKQSVVYWAEYVIRHRGAPHLQSPLIHMTWYEATNLDVIGLISVVLIIILYLIKFVVKLIFKCINKSSKNKVE